MDVLVKPNPKLEKKIEQMKKQNFKAQAREASFNFVDIFYNINLLNLNFLILKIFEN